MREQREGAEVQAAQTRGCRTCSLVARYLIITGPPSRSCRAILRHSCSLTAAAAQPWQHRENPTQTQLQPLHILSPG